MILTIKEEYTLWAEDAAIPEICYFSSDFFCMLPPFKERQNNNVTLSITYSAALRSSVERKELEDKIKFFSLLLGFFLFISLPVGGGIALFYPAYKEGELALEQRSF